MWPIIWTNYTQGCFVPSFVEIGPVLVEKNFFFLNFIIILHFRFYLPLELSVALQLIKLESSLPRMDCAKFGWNSTSGSGGEDFLISSMYFCSFVIISPWKKAGPFIWKNLNPLYPKLLYAKFGWNWSSGSGEEDKNVKSLQTDGRTDGCPDRRTDRRRTKGKTKGAVISLYQHFCLR